MKILFVNPSHQLFYSVTKGKVTGSWPPLNLATLAAEVKLHRHRPRILDLNLSNDAKNDLLAELENFAPDYVGITATTPLFPSAMEISHLVKNFNKKIKVILGGAHATALYQEIINEDAVDLVVIGEGDIAITEILNGVPLPKIKGITCKNGNQIFLTGKRELISNLDILAFPDWSLFEIGRYLNPHMLTRKNPAGWIETSRGCPFSCYYCTKNIFGQGFRVKSPERVVKEMEYMLNCGFKEIHIADDVFTTDFERAMKICDEIIRKKLTFPWATLTGIRPDQVNRELLSKMKKSGCYRVYFGIESGCQEVLNGFGKGFTLATVRKAVEEAKAVGLEVYGFFMLGLLEDTAETMNETINFAVSLPFDMAKTTIMTPLPGTRLFGLLEERGKIKTKDWSKYNLYLPQRDVWDHPILTWEQIERAYSKFYRRFYFRLGFIFKRIISLLLRGQLLKEMKYFFKVDW